MKRSCVAVIAVVLWFALGSTCLYIANHSYGNKGEQALFLFAMLSYGMSLLCFCAWPRLSSRPVPFPGWNHTMYEAMAQRILYDARRHRERRLKTSSS